MKRLTSALIILLPTLIFAAESGGDLSHKGGVPKVLLYQAINIAIVVVGLVDYARDAVVDFFRERKLSYLAAAHKSALAREEAEKRFLDIKHKIAQLSTTEEHSLAKAREHAEEIKQQILAESKEVSLRIREEARLTVQLETKKAQRELREQLLKASFEAARAVLSKDIGGNDHQKLQGDFVKSIEVMQ
jgi:F-type H+-transporting ATPase subunit b